MTLQKGGTLKHLIMALLAAGLAANAQTSTTTVTTETQTTNESSAKIQDLQKKDEQMKDIDEEITNARMRAALGSKSKWSVRTALNYQGGSVEKPFDQIRPNYRGAVGTNATSYFSGDIAIKRRLGDMDSINFGTGLVLYRPFHRTFEESTNQNGSRNMNVSSPYLEYNVAYKLGGLQSSTALTYVHSTTDFDVNTIGTTGGADISQMFIGEIGTSLSVGASISIGKTFYKDGGDFDRTGSPKVALDAGLYPFLEYAFNDKYSFRTVFGYAQFQEFENDRGEFHQITPYQSMGIGISVARDFYLYPNVQFTPKDIRSDLTNVGLSANINLF